MSVDSVAVVCSLLSLNLDQIVVAERPSILMGVRAFPPNVKRPGEIDDASDASSTPLLFPSLINAQSNISMDEYRQSVHLKFMALQEKLSVTFQYYIGSVQPSINNRGVKYHYILYYVPTTVAEVTVVPVRPEASETTTWARLDTSGLQRVLDTALATLSSTFSAKPYNVETAGGLLNIIDPTEFEVMLAALTKINVKQADRNEWYAPLLDISNAITAQTYQIELYKKDDERRRQQQHSSSNVDQSNGDKSVSVANRDSLTDELSNMTNRFNKTLNKNVLTMTSDDLKEIEMPTDEKKYVKQRAMEPIPSELHTPKNPKETMSKRLDAINHSEDVFKNLSLNDDESGTRKVLAPNSRTSGSKKRSSNNVKGKR